MKKIHPLRYHWLFLVGMITIGMASCCPDGFRKARVSLPREVSSVLPYADGDSLRFVSTLQDTLLLRVSVSSEFFPDTDLGSCIETDYEWRWVELYHLDVPLLSLFGSGEWGKGLQAVVRLPGSAEEGWFFTYRQQGAWDCSAPNLSCLDTLVVNNQKYVDVAVITPENSLPDTIWYNRRGLLQFRLGDGPLYRLD